MVSWRASQVCRPSRFETVFPLVHACALYFWSPHSPCLDGIHPNLWRSQRPQSCRFGIRKSPSSMSSPYLARNDLQDHRARFSSTETCPWIISTIEIVPNMSTYTVRTRLSRPSTLLSRSYRGTCWSNFAESLICAYSRFFFCFNY